MDSPPSLRQRIYEMLMESQHWRPGQMLAYQRSQLGQLLHHARTEVPFYKERLAPLFRKNGTIDWQRWQELPIVTRTDIKDQGKAMMAQTLPKGHGPTSEVASSGTTGLPITVRGSNGRVPSSGVA